MFKTSKNETKLDMFSSISDMLHGQSLEQYSNSLAWHNIFREQLFARIDENMFKPLFNKRMGVPLMHQ